MKVGDLVMFNNTESRYAKWFYGQFGIVENCNGGVFSSSCRVTWLQPVKYFDSFSTYSDFGADNFTICNS